MAEGNIIYALVARGVVPLSGYSNFTGTFDQMCINYLKNIGPDTSAAVKLDNGYIIFYMNERSITYLIMAESSYPKEAAIGCLESIKKEFQSTYEGKNIDMVERFGLNSEFQTKLRMKFDYFNSNKDISNEALGRLKDEMNKMKDNVVQASGLLNERSDKIKVLDDKADVLSRDSNTFYKTSKKVRRAELMKKLKLYGGIACAILILIYIIICISCGSLTFNC
jgi:hypothetical protein